MGNAKIVCKQCEKYVPRETIIDTGSGKFCSENCKAEWAVNHYIKSKAKAKNKNPAKKKPKSKKIEKIGNPYRNRKYLDWVKTLPCCMCGNLQGNDPHHAIGMKLGGMATKAPDDMSMSLCRKCHNEMHAKPGLWFLQNGFIIKTKKEADKLGIKYAY